MGSMCSSCSDTKDSAGRNRGETERLNRPLGTSVSESEDITGGSSTTGQDDWLFELNLQETLFEKLAKFIKSLPPNSKKHIWAHAVRVKNDDGSKVLVDKTQNESQICRLLSDCVIVYVKYIDRKRAPLSRKTVQSQVQPASQWIQKKKHMDH